MWRARQEIGQLLRSYDCSNIDEPLLRTLASAGCADVAAILASNDNAIQVGRLSRLRSFESILCASLLHVCAQAG